jgi:hypothetical protein
MALKPANMSFEQAATVPIAAVTALQALRDQGHLQAGQKVLINNTVVVLPHKAIEFTEHHYTADLTDDEGRERAAWLLQCKAYRTGEIVLVPNVAFKPVTVRTGPRTSGMKPDQIQRPAGPLSVTVGAN